MKTKVAMVLTAVFTVVLAQCCLADAPASLHGRYGRYIVYTTGETAVKEAARQGVEDQAGLTLKELVTQTGLVVVIPQVAKGPIASIPGVVAVEPDVVLSAVKGPPPGKGPNKEPPPQPEETLPWGVDRIDADLVWDADGNLVVDEGAITGSGADIAIIDTGIDKDHPDLEANIAGGQNFVGKGPPWRRKVDSGAWDDDNGHGTHVAGIAAAVDNGVGVIGAAPAASLWAVKVLDKTGSGYLSDVIDGIYWATDHGMDVINMSLGIDKEALEQYPNDRQALKDAVDDAYNAGVVVVAAAGNEGPGEDTVIYPARFESVIAVSATDSADNLASFSSTGPSVELAAAGVDIYSTWNDGLYDTHSGTSMASPHVAGTAALVLASGSLTDLDGNGYVDNVDVRLQLQNTADALGESSWYGYGLVDAEEAATGTQTNP